jgi:hypothetical protein
MSLAEEVRTVRQRVAERLRELEPLVREYDELRKIASEMGLDEVGHPARQRAAPPARAQAAGGQIGERVLEAVRGDPGKTVADYAKSLDVAATSLYRPVRELTDTGLLVKRARQLFPAE